ncbi:MAG TPA: hypothetical protein VM077_06070 [Candidatus Limnocylindrales bacterium]|nr:hypothetical protein [Candidatus Limnocylindrales bacterium]
MATVVNNPPAAAPSEGGGGSGFLLGIIVLIVFVILFVFYGLPMLNNTASNAGVQAPQVNVPDKVDVNVKQQP